MTSEHQYSIKDMLTRIEERSIEDRGVMNKKIDEIGEDIKEFRDESRAADIVQNEKIEKISSWKDSTMAIIKAAMWVISGLGGLTGIYFLLVG